MDNITQYLFANYLSLMSVAEYAAYMSLIMDEKAEAGDSPHMTRMREVTKRGQPSAKEAAALLADGPEAFHEAVRERILRECADQLFLNYCPKCGALARTPRSRQCPVCFYAWRDAEGGEF